MDIEKFIDEEFIKIHSMLKEIMETGIHEKSHEVVDSLSSEQQEIMKEYIHKWGSVMSEFLRVILTIKHSFKD
jgi:hypothetical protein